MLTEIQALLGVAGVTLALVALQGAVAPLRHGLAYGVGPRDEIVEKSVLEGRAGRTLANQIEGLMLFLPLVVAVVALDASTPMTAMGATIYLAARIVFAAFYLLGVPYLRSLSWGVGIAGLVIMAWSVVPVAFG